MAGRRRILRRRVLKINQNSEHPLYLFSLNGKDLLSIADISRISRTSTGKLIGYQRPAVKRHVKDIVDYLNTDNVIFPNSIILSLSSDVRFVRSRGPNVEDDAVMAGTLEIPIPKEGDEKPAWIVDGQQRALALSMSKRQDMPIPINAFVADEIAIQRDQFLRVNSSKPLPRGLIAELLPEVSTPLPDRLAATKIPSALCNLLNTEKDSPFFGLIKRSSMSEKDKKMAVITDTSVIKMLHESINSPSGCLFPYRNIATGETDFDEIWGVLYTYWTGVKNTFDSAWGKPPSKSRLMHGAGIRAMGRLMDRIMSSMNERGEKGIKKVEKELARVAPLCRWTSGQWEEMGGIRWNEVQNVPRHISVLSNYLVRAYVEPTGRR